MVKRAPILMVSAIASGQGKTSVTAALARRYQRAGKTVRVFKTGADFIDPMMLEAAAGGAVHSLDLWLAGEDEARAQLERASREADLVLIEGVMGLYDGEPSSADLARAFDIPILLVIDASAMAQTLGAVVLGLRDYGEVNVAGVIANRVASPGHLAMLKKSLRDVPLLGHLPRQVRIFPERHLGLVLPEEQQDLDTVLDDLASSLQLDEGAWQHLYTSARQTVSVDISDGQSEPSIESKETEQLLAGKCIAIARDAAFAFIYPANVDCLRALGADLVYFSPLRDEAVPEYADAIFLPGGYPELHAETLSKARLWQASMHRAHNRGLTIVAECGGMMSLASQLVDKNGKSWPMADLLEGSIHLEARLQALGMQFLPTNDGDLRGHSFHFSRFDTRLTPARFAMKHSARDVNDGLLGDELSAEHQGEAVYAMRGLIASYFHAYFPSNPRATAALFLGRF